MALVAAPLIAAAAPAAAQTYYRAGGSEPVWRVSIDGRTMKLEEPGRTPVVVPLPVAHTTAAGERWNGRGLVVDTTRARCTLANGDYVYRDMVIVEIDGRVLRGCGLGATGAQLNAMVLSKSGPGARSARPALASAPSKPAPQPPAPVARPTVASAPVVARPAPVASAAAPPRAAPVMAPPPPPPPAGAPLALGNTRPALANTRWTVWKMREQEIKTPQPLTVNFSGNQIEGQLCNRFRGGYALAGERLQASSLTATRMACQGPATGVENMVFAMLRQATRATVSKWGTLTLGNGKDTVMLRPVR